MHLDQLQSQQDAAEPGLWENSQQRDRGRKHVPEGGEGVASSLRSSDGPRGQCGGQPRVAQKGMFPGSWVTLERPLPGGWGTGKGDIGDDRRAEGDSQVQATLAQLG